MKIAIVGASSGTGRLLAAQALEAGHEVRAVSRSGNVPEGAQSIQGSATDPTVLETAISGADAVVVTVGGSKDDDRNRTKVTRAVVDAMTGGPSRIIVQSSLGAGDSDRQMGPVLRKFAMIALAKPLADHNDQEKAVQGSDLDWTIVRPSGLTDKPRSGAYKVKTVQEPGSLGKSIPRADVAAFILTCLGDDSTIGKAYGIAS